MKYKPNFPKVDYVRVVLTEKTTCDECGKQLTSRKNIAFLSKKYGITLCLPCWTLKTKRENEK